MKKFLLLIGFFVAFSSVHAQIGFQDHSILEFHSDGANSVDVGDLDGDGDLDVVGSGYDNFGTNAFLWFENDNSNEFPVHVIDKSLSTAEGATNVNIIDIDSDGDLDVIGVGYRADTFQWYENDGSGNFITHIIDDTREDNIMMVGQDLDQDGDIDLLAAAGAYYSAGIFLWYENDGKQNFNSHIISQSPPFGNAYAISSTDIDGDGDFDILTNSSDKRLGWYENDGNQNFGVFHRIDDKSTFGINSIVDLDKDGDNDIISIGSNAFAWFENDGTGNFTKNTVNDEGEYAFGANSVSYGDLDSDGDLDILGTISRNISKFVWFENDGSQNFTPNTISDGHGFRSLTTGAEQLIAHDMNSDGFIDLIGAARDSDAYSFYENDGSQKFKWHRLNKFAYLANDANAVSCGDINNDGTTDIVGSSFEGDSFSWFENDGNGNFSTHLVNNSPLNSENPYDVKVVDIDSDGYLDVIGTGYLGLFSWFKNDGKGNFELFSIEKNKNIANGAKSVDYCDLDGDGDMDVLGAALIADNFLWFENDGFGNFTTNIISSNLTYTDGANSISCADLDNDGDLDILGVARQADSFVWFEYNGTNNFTPHLLEEGVTGNTRLLNDIKAADVDNDNDLDIIGTGFTNPDAFHLYINDGTGNFNKQEVTGEPIFGELSLHDLDRDGYIDVFGNDFDGLVYYKNSGDYYFVKISLADYNIKSPIEFSDIDGDSVEDIIGVNTNSFRWVEVKGVETGVAIDVTITEGGCNNPSNGKIEVAARGGTPPYQYRIDSQEYQVSNLFENLLVGQYMVEAIDSDGITVSDSVEIGKPSALILDLTVSEVSCIGQNDGKIEIAASGGTLPYEYSVDGITYTSESSFIDLTADIYTVHVRDAVGCSQVKQVTISAVSSADYDNDGIGDKCDDDIDGDGVINKNDSCPETIHGSNVNDKGCTLFEGPFTLPATNFTIQTTSETCGNSNNGKIEIAVKENHEYTVVLSGNGSNSTKTFTEAVDFTGLQAGNFDLCFTVTGEPGYRKCFFLNIAEPEDLQVDSEVDTSGKLITLKMKGGKNYSINVNGKVYQTSDNEITLPLTNSKNIISVKTDYYCQGLHQEAVLLAQEVLVFPNPIKEGDLTLVLGNRTSELVLLTLATSNGTVLFQTNQEPVNGNLKINVDSFSSGTYLLQIRTENQTYTHKIIKK